MKVLILCEQLCGTLLNINKYFIYFMELKVNRKIIFVKFIYEVI